MNTDRREFLKAGAASAFAMAGGAAMAGAVPGTDLMTQYSEVVIDAMRAAYVRRPVAMGQVIIADVLGLGVDVVATREL